MQHPEIIHELPNVLMVKNTNFSLLGVYTVRCTIKVITQQIISQSCSKFCWIFETRLPFLSLTQYHSKLLYDFLKRSNREKKTKLQRKWKYNLLMAPSSWNYIPPYEFICIQSRVHNGRHFEMKKKTKRDIQ